MISPVDRICDSRDTSSISNHPDKGSRTAKLLHNLCSGALTQCANHTLARNQDFLSIMRLANNAFGCDSKRFVPRMDINMFFEFFQEKGTMPYIGIRRQIVPHLNQMDMFALQSQMDGTFRTGQAAAKDHNFVADRILFL